MAPGCPRAVPLNVQRRKALPTTPRRLAAARTSHRLATGLVGLSLAITAWAPAAPRVAAAEEDPTGGLEPTIHYEEALRHAGDTTSFEAGGRVTVGFVPRASDRALIGGAAPRALPAGRLTGRELRRAAPTPAEPNGVKAPTPAVDPADPTPDAAGTPSPDPTEAPAAPSPAASDLPSAAPPSAAPSDAPALDQPSADPEAVIAADPIAWTGATDDDAPISPPRSRRAACARRSSGSCRTGRYPTARSSSTTRSCRRSPSSASARPPPAPWRRRPRAARRPSAGAAGRARG